MILTRVARLESAECKPASRDISAITEDRLPYEAATPAPLVRSNAQPRRPAKDASASGV